MLRRQLLKYTGLLPLFGIKTNASTIHKFISPFITEQETATQKALGIKNSDIINKTIDFTFCNIQQTVSQADGMIFKHRLAKETPSISFVADTWSAKNIINSYETRVPLIQHNDWLIDLKDLICTHISSCPKDKHFYVNVVQMHNKFALIASDFPVVEKIPYSNV